MHHVISQHYDVPSVSNADAVVPYFSAKCPCCTQTVSIMTPSPLEASWKPLLGARRSVKLTTWRDFRAVHCASYKGRQSLPCLAFVIVVQVLNQTTYACTLRFRVYRAHFISNCKRDENTIFIKCNFIIDTYAICVQFFWCLTIVTVSKSVGEMR